MKIPFQHTMPAIGALPRSFPFVVPTAAAILLSCSLAFADTCGELAEADAELARSWSQLEREYPILLPTLRECFRSTRNSTGGEQAVLMVMCAVIPCGFAGSETCTNLALRVIELFARQDVIERQKREAGCM